MKPSKEEIFVIIYKNTYVDEITKRVVGEDDVAEMIMERMYSQNYVLDEHLQERKEIIYYMLHNTLSGNTEKSRLDGILNIVDDILDLLK